MSAQTYDLATKTWYDAKKVGTPGSVVLNAWRAEHGPEARRLAQRAASVARRSYAGAMIGRTTADWTALSTSADAELYTSLRALRNRCRQLVRDNEYAKHALRLIVNNVVGQGIGFQSEVMMQRGGRLNDPVNSKIEAAWARWGKAKYCHAAAKLSWSGIQRMAMRSVAESGEVLIRKIKRRVPGSPVPFQLEVLESDHLVDNWSGRTPSGTLVRMGVEVDDFERPIAYWLYPRHPGDNMIAGVPQTNEYQRVPADEIIHLAVFERPMQTRGVPWFHAAMTKIRHMGGYEEALIVRARASASVMGFIQSPEVDDGLVNPGAAGGSDAMGTDDVVNGEKVFDMSPGIIKELAPGETFEGFDPKSADATVEPFMRFMLRSVAAGIGCSYESLSRDYSQSNYSSSRLALLDDRDHWKVLQQWLMESLHQEVFEEWLKYAVMDGLNLPSYEASPEIYEAVRWMPRGWDWVDPLKEVTAARMAVRAGLSSVQDIVSAKGGDYEDTFKQLAREHALAKDLDLVLETDPAQVTDKGQVQAPAVLDDVGIDGAGADSPGGSGGSGGNDSGNDGTGSNDSQGNAP